MGLRTKEEYVESLRNQKPKVYMLGEEVNNIVDHRMFYTGINSVGISYQCAEDPKYQNMITLRSPLIDEPINLFTNIMQSSEEFVTKVKLMREITQRHICILRCSTSDALTGLFIATYEIDQKYNTSYHQKALEFIKRVQKNDLALSIGMTDAKGNRRKRPSEQADPDTHLHIVNRRKDGIVVRGAKAHITGACYMNEMLVFPTRNLKDDEKDYAVGFAMPVDTEGVTYICRPPGVPREERKLESRISSQAGQIECLVVFEDVFVPWERVFMCGEWEFVVPMVANFANIHRVSKCGCIAGQTDLMIGAAALVAEYNDLDRASQIKDKLTSMISAAEIGFAGGITAAIHGSKHPSGAFIPSALHSNVGKFHISSKSGENYYLMHDIGGGPSITYPSEKDYFNPETANYMEKYFKGKEGVPTEHRFRAIKLVEDFTASRFGGWLMGMISNGAGSPMAERIDIFRNYDLKKRKQIAKSIAGITEE